MKKCLEEKLVAQTPVDIERALMIYADRPKWVTPPIRHRIVEVAEVFPDRALRLQALETLRTIYDKEAVERVYNNYRMKANLRSDRDVERFCARKSDQDEVCYAAGVMASFGEPSGL
ncbi:MAG: hypothetical protein AAFV53_23370 [Myxococcota bacterium]